MPVCVPAQCLRRAEEAYPKETAPQLERCYRELEESGLRRVTEEWTFSSFQARESWQREMKAGAERYAADPQGWLLMAGQPGTGKSHLCTAIFRTVLGKGLAARYFSWYFLAPFTFFQDTFMDVLDAALVAGFFVLASLILNAALAEPA